MHRNACINVMNNKYAVVTPTIAPYLNHLLLLIVTQNCVFQSRSVHLRQNRTPCGAHSVDPVYLCDSITECVPRLCYLMYSRF